jgi:HD-GYP domain-containing protein (c-di-GMP phosphodiesterase class II)
MDGSHYVAARRPAPAASALRLSELLGALSHALDLTEGQPPGHCVRCCWIGLQVGRQAGLGPAELRDLYYTLLLKDLGCSSNAARICELYLTDDLHFKHDFKLVGASLPQVVRFVIGHTGLQAGLLERFRGILNIFQNGGQIARELIETRCTRGAEIARQLRFSEAVAEGIRSLDEHWDGSGKAQGLAGEAIPIGARIALLAQVADVFRTSQGPEAAREEVRRRTGSWFDPRLVQAFEAVAAHPIFWRTLESERIDRIVFALEPAQGAVVLDEDYLDDIAAAFGRIVDAKSPYTSGHSTRVALYADLVAERLGLPAERRRWLRRGALLHDLGKLGVSNALLDKPGRLDAAEWEQMRRHAALTGAILSRIGAFAELAAICAAHHERLDGRGYPLGLQGDEIALETRIITTADIFDALTADRPYREALPVERALEILRGDVGTAIDPPCLAALEAVVAEMGAAPLPSVQLDARGGLAAQPVAHRVEQHAPHPVQREDVHAVEG